MWRGLCGGGCLWGEGIVRRLCGGIVRRRLREGGCEEIVWKGLCGSVGGVVRRICGGDGEECELNIMILMIVISAMHRYRSDECVCVCVCV